MANAKDNSGARAATHMVSAWKCGVLFNQNNLGENRTFKKLSTTVTLLLSSPLNKQHFTEFNKFLPFKLFFSSLTFFPTISANWAEIFPCNKPFIWGFFCQEALPVLVSTPLICFLPCTTRIASVREKRAR